ncbi:MAG: DUF2812 domain-containing protein [Oscillospiraceae bacterium]|nr:DUF2812 domain-containing protein [Oscillospiraceae bacterium]
MSETRTVLRPAPCPAWDLEGMENWLEDMAAQGLRFQADSFLFGFASFEPGEPEEVRYRLEPGRKQLSTLGPGEASPDGEALDLHESQGWEYAGRRGQFFIYRSALPLAPEPDTDPEVQALALGGLRKRLLSGWIGFAVWLAVYLFFSLRGPVYAALALGSGFLLFTGLLVLAALLGQLAAIRSLGKLRRQLRAGEGLTHRKDWRRGRFFHWGKVLLLTLLWILWLGLLLGKWAAGMEHKGEMLPRDYGEDVPFPTISELTGQEEAAYQFFFGTDLQFNHLRAWSDLLAPENYDWRENARVTFRDGSALDGSWYVEYHRMASEGLARELMREYALLARLERGSVKLDIPDFGLDGQMARVSRYHFPTLYLRKGTVVVRAYGSFSSGTPLALEEWGRVLAESLP